ncbi:MAG: acetoacetate decarboxylase family protein [Nitrospirae bacterium]|nr:acetoacetate decarboxylase family protein [Nitrospirota bacterium]
MTPVAQARAARVSPSDRIPTSQEFGLSVSDYPAPYLAHGDAMFLVFRVSRDQVAQVLRPPYAPRSVLGRHVVLVEVNRFYSVGGSGRGRPMDPYLEVVYYTPVSFEGGKAFHFFKLYLDSMAPVILGRELFGYPKELADDFVFEVTSSEILARVRKGGRSVLDVRATRGHVLNHVLPFRKSAVQLAMTSMARGVPVAAFYPDDRHVILTSFDSLACSSAEFLTVSNCHVGEYVESGLFPEGEALRPLAAFFVKDLRGSMGEPVRRLRAAM